MGLVGLAPRTQDESTGCSRGEHVDDDGDASRSGIEKALHDRAEPDTKNVAWDVAGQFRIRHRAPAERAGPRAEEKGDAEENGLAPRVVRLGASRVSDEPGAADEQGDGGQDGGRSLPSDGRGNLPRQR